MRYPMKLRPAMKYRIWGGEKLKNKYGKTADIDRLGETWELSVRDDGMSVVENGPYTGKTLKEVLAELGTDAVSPSYDGGVFPLLIKLIDATDRLSVQVHPDDRYAAEKENDVGKTEMWVVLEADEGAELVFDLRAGVTREDFAAAARAGDIEETLNACPVKAGDVFFIPSGMVHAIGAGIVIAEIQQNSDLTYRVYDYNRRQSDGSLRELHVEKALDVVRPFRTEEIDAIRYAAKTEKDGAENLAHCRYFCTDRLVLSHEPLACVADETTFHALLCTRGEGSILCAGTVTPIKQGETYFIPAKTGEYSLAGDAEILRAAL
ncbi:MAG: class I mannose-6-phosphate isomerase [Clostridia bacterium]|nr:class I mannose-6-phosphate isomerase [Clostridia bacterium]